MGIRNGIQFIIKHRIGFDRYFNLLLKNGAINCNPPSFLYELFLLCINANMNKIC